MFKVYKYGVLAFALVVMAMIWSYTPVMAQGEPGDITEGNDYWFAIPNCKTAQNEQIRWAESPIQIWVASRSRTSFTIESSDGATLPRKTYDIAPGIVVAIQVTEDLMLRDADNERATWKGIHIVSKEPVTVGVFLAYKWSGEAYRVIPSEWLGKEYYTVNLWQDKVKMASGGEPELKPGEFVIVATEDGTNVEYTPKVQTPKTNAGATTKVVLRKGQSYIVHAKTSDALSWNTAKSDLTGSYIRADKPIAVISGHTKGAYPQYPATMYGIKTDFIRNMLTEMIWPKELLAKEYISAPLKYLARPFGNAVANERGDLIRFVATEPNTVVKEGKYNATTKKMEYVNISTVLQAGDFCDIPNRESYGYYVATKPVLVAQIGKAWVDHLPPPKIGSSDTKDGDGEIQNPSKNGQGMMFILAPIEKWCSYATFRLIEGMTGSFVYFTFRMADQDKIFFDGQKFSTLFGNAVNVIPGTPYGYVIEAVAPGDHTVEAIKGANFAGYAYGNFDATKDGFAYGYPIGMNFATVCDDSLIAKDTIICDSLPGTCTLKYTGTGDTSCLGFFRVTLKEADTLNVDYHPLTPLTKELRQFKFYFKVRDMKMPAHAKLEFKTKSGRVLVKEYDYQPQVVAFDQESMYFGIQNPGEKDSCNVFKIENKGEIPLEVKSMKQLIGDNNFVVQFNKDDFPFTLAAGESRTFNVCAHPQVMSNDTIRDTVRVFHQCYFIDLPLKVTTGEPIIDITDIHFGARRVNTSTTMPFRIDNNSNFKVVLTSMPVKNISPAGVFVPDFAGKFPMEIPAWGNQSINVTFTPNALTDFNDTANAIGNVYKTKLYSAWDGKGTNAGSAITGYDWQKRRVVDGFVTGPNYDAAKGKYVATLYITAFGNESVQFNGQNITVNPDNAFELGQIPVNQMTSTMPPVEVPVWFKPGAEKDYVGKVVINTSHGDIESEIRGFGVLPHMMTSGIDFGTIKMNDTKNDFGSVDHKRHPDLDNGSAGAQKYDTTLRVYRVYIDGPDASSFEILNPLGSQLDLVEYTGTNFNFKPEIKFSPKRVGDFKAMLRVETDAPSANVAKNIDINYAELKGSAYSTGFNSTGCDFPLIFRKQVWTIDKNTGTQAKVTFTNNGSSSITLNKNITWAGGDWTQFKITDLSKPVCQAGYVMAPGETITLNVTFTPQNEGTFTTNIVFEGTDFEGKTVNASPAITGSARFMTSEVLVNVIDKDNITPGEKRSVDVALYTTDGQALLDANVRKFMVKVYYSPDQANQTSFIAKPLIESVTDIVTTGTMTEGWTAELMSSFGRTDSVFAVVFTQNDANKPLQAGFGNVLFRFNIQTYYATMKSASYVPEISYTQHTANDNWPVAEYLEKTAVKGPFSIRKVCTDDLREIVVGAVAELGKVMPNPVATSTVSFDYTVSFDNTETTIILYNSVGAEVIRMVDGPKEAGIHEVKLDIDALGLSNGSYYYRMISGNFTGTYPMVIAR